MRINKSIGNEDGYKQECVCNYLNHMNDEALLIYAEEELGIKGWSVEYCRLALKYNFQLIYPRIEQLNQKKETN